VSYDLSEGSVRPRHWPLAERLIVEFPTVAPVDVLSAVLAAWHHVEVLGLRQEDEAAAAARIATETLRSSVAASASAPASR
jgi:hypothetical protein